MASAPGASVPAFFGPRVVRAAFVLAVFGWGVGFYGPPIYLNAVVQRTGWPLGWVSAAVTVHFLSGVLVVARLPRLHARFGVPATLVTGAVVTTLGIGGWALAAAPWQLFAAALASGMGWVTMGAVTVNAVVSPWHVRTRPQALATAYNGGSLGGVLFSPLWVALIAGCGFAGAALVVGLVMVPVMAFLGQRVFAHTPQSLDQQPDGDAMPAHLGAIDKRPTLPGALLWRHRRFQTLAAGMAIGLFAQIGLLAHLFSLLVPLLGAQAAGLAMGAATVCTMLGRVGVARLLRQDRDRRFIAGAGYAVQALGALALMFAGPGQLALMGLGIALVGSGLGNATSLPPMIAQQDFAAQDVPRVVALIVALSQASYAFAPLVFGLLLAASAGGAPGTGLGPQSTGLFAVATGVLLVAAACFFWRPRATLSSSVSIKGA